ncbi:hypothetical protein ABPG72_002918 [Tetrahymena utriculariae]
MSDSIGMQSVQTALNSISQADLSEAEKTSIQVTVRIRPLNEKELSENEISCVKVDPNYPNTITLETTSFESKMFCFDYIAHQFTPQQEVFNKVALPAADSCLEGYNGCIFAYGQTGAGKTYTITGASNIESVLNTDHRGMLPRVLEYIFQKIKQQQSLSVEYLVKCSYLEIYNEHIIDLLSDNGNNLQLREDLKKGVYVEGLTEYVTQNFLQAIEILKTGSGNRHNGATSMNRESSRSHSVFSIILQSKALSEGVTHLRYSRFHFVDLAGSERTKQTNAMGERLKEGCNINKSLSILGNVINALVEVDNGRARHIHYRDSKLTFFLKDSLGGNSKTRVIANISPASSAFQETLSTLKFAKRAKLIKNKVQINEDHSGNVESLNNEIKKLRLENLQFREMLMKGGSMLSFFQSNNSQPQSPSFREQKNNLRMIKDENIKMQETEELCQHYLEQAQELELKMNYNMGKTKDQLMHLMKYVEKFQQNEYQYRSIIKLQRAKIERVEQMLKNKQLTKEQVQEFFNEDREKTQKELNDLRELLENQMYCAKLLDENVELQQQVEKIQEPGRSIFQQLTNNVDVLKSIQNKLEQNIEQRIRLQKVVEDLEESKKNASPDRSKKLEFQLTQIEKEHKSAIENLSSELLTQKLKLNEQERMMDQIVEENHKLSKELEQMKLMQEFKQAQHEETVHQLKKLIAEKSNVTDEKNSELHLRNIDLVEQIKQLQQQNLLLNERSKESDKQRQDMAEEKKQAHEKYLKYLEKYNEETTHLQASISELTSNFNEKEFENLRIKDEVIQGNERIRELESNISQAKQIQDSLQQEIEQKKNQIEQLEEQLIELEEADNQRKDLQEEIETLNETLNFRENELEEMKKQKTQLLNQIQELQAAKVQIEEQVQTLQMRIEELESQSSEQNNKLLQEKVGEMKKLEDEKGVVELELNQMRKAKEEDSIVIQNKLEQIKSLEQEKVFVQQKINEISDEKERITQVLEGEINILKEKLLLEDDQKQEVINQKQTEIEELRQQVQLLKSSIEKEIESFNSQRIAIEETFKKEKQETLLQCKRDLQEQCEQLQQNFSIELEKQIEIREKKIAKLEEEKSKAIQQSQEETQQELETLKEDLERQVVEITEQKDQEIKQIIEKNSEELQVLQNEKQQLLEQIQQSKDEIQMHQNSIQAYEQQIQELESSLIEKESLYIEKNNSFKEQQSKLRHLESESTQLKEEAQELKDKTSQLAESLEGQTQAYSKAKAEVEKLQNEILYQQEKILQQENTIKILKERQLEESSQSEKYLYELEDKARFLEQEKANMVKLNNQLQQESDEKLLEKENEIANLTLEKKQILDSKLQEIEGIVKLQLQDKEISLQKQEMIFNERIKELEELVQQAISEKEITIVQYENQNKEKDNKISGLLKQIEESSQSIQNQNEEIDSLNQEVILLRQKISQKEKEKQENYQRESKEKHDLIEKHAEEKQDLQDSLESRFSVKQKQLEEQIKNYQEQLSNEQETYQSQIEQKEMIIEEHQSIIDELKTEIEGLKTQRFEKLSEQEQLYENQQQENRLLVKQIENLKKEIVNKSEQLIAEREEQQEAQKQFNMQIQQIEEKNYQEISKIQQESQEAIQTVEKQIQEQKTQLEKIIKQKEEELQKANQLIKQVKEQLSQEKSHVINENNNITQKMQQQQQLHLRELNELQEQNKQILAEAENNQIIFNQAEANLQEYIAQLKQQLDISNNNLEEERNKFLQKFTNLQKESEQNTQKQVLLTEALRDDKWKAEKEQILHSHKLTISQKENELFEKNQELLQMKQQLEEFKSLSHTYQTKLKEIQESNEKQNVINTQIFTKQLDQVNTEKNSLKQNVESLNAKLFEKTEEAQKLIIQNGEHLTKTHQLEQVIQEKETKIIQLSKNIQQQDTYIQKTAQEIQQKKDIIQTLNEEYSKVIQQNEQLKHQISETQTQLEKLSIIHKQKEVERLEFVHKSQLEELENKHNEELNKIFEERRIMLEQLEEQKQQKDSEIEELCLKYAEEIDNFKKLTKNLQNQNEFLEKENTEKEELCNQFQVALNEFKQELNKRDELLYLQEEYEKLVEVNKILENDLEKKTKMIEESKANLIQAKRDMQEMKKILDQKNKEIEGQKNELKEFYERTQVFAQTRDKDVKEVKDQYCKLLDEHNKIMSQYNEQSEKMDKLKVEISDYAKEKAQINQEIRKLQSNEKKLIQQLNDMIEVNKRLYEDNKKHEEELENVQRELQCLGGHNNPDQKIKMFNKIKEENTLLKNEKKELSTQLAQIVEENKQLLKQIEQLRTNPDRNNPLKNIGNQRFGNSSSSTDKSIQMELEKQMNENKKLQDIIIQTNQIIQMGSSNKGLNQFPKSSIDKDLISGVKQIVQEILDKENKIKDLSRELDAKTIKYTEIEKKYLQLQLNVKDSSYLNNMNRERSKDRFGAALGSNSSIQQQQQQLQQPMSYSNLNHLNQNINLQNYTIQQQQQIQQHQAQQNQSKPNRLNFYNNYYN